MDVIRDPDGNWCVVDESGTAVSVFGPSEADYVAAWHWADAWMDEE